MRCLHSWLPPALAMLSTTSLAAQTLQVEWKAHSAMSVDAHGQRATFPKGTPLGQNTKLTVNNLLLRSTATVTTQLTTGTSTGTARFSILEDANAGPIATASTGSHDTLMVVRSSSPLPAVVTVTFTGTSSGSPLSSRASAAVDIDNDNKLDFQATGTGTVRKQFTVVIRSQGIVLRTQTSTGVAASKALTGAAMRGDLRIDIAPAPGCATDSFGRSCGNGQTPATLTGQMRGRQLDLTLSSARPKVTGFQVVGLKRVTTPIPGSPCSLLTDIVVLLMFQTDGQGHHKQTIPIPASAKGTAYLQQVLVLQSNLGTTFESTNGVQLVCR